MPCDRCMYATQLRGLHAGIRISDREKTINLAKAESPVSEPVAITAACHICRNTVSGAEAA